MASRTPSTTTERFDWIAAGFGMWLAVGLALDLWAHHHLAATLESFFTPWHAVLYTGFVIGAVWLLSVQFRDGLPAGYGLSLVGAGIFALGGFIDAVWHTLFGIEVDIEGR
jgi:hypothetical protein